MITLKIKDTFFDRPAVINAVGKARAKALSKAGAFVRQTARTSIRKRKGTAPAGKPPHSHEGSLRRGIAFGYDRAADSVLVGPESIRNSPAPAALERGGPSTRTFYSAKAGRVLRREINVRPRPYMLPALERERAKLPELFKNILTKG